MIHLLKSGAARSSQTRKRKRYQLWEEPPRQRPGDIYEEHKEEEMPGIQDPFRDVFYNANDNKLYFNEVLSVGDRITVRGLAT